MFPSIVIEGDGQGIPEQELAVLTAEEETDLQHGSGVGLWLMKWYVEKSNGELHVTDTEEGARVEMELPRV